MLKECPNPPLSPSPSGAVVQRGRGPHLPAAGLRAGAVRVGGRWLSSYWFSVLLVQYVTGDLFITLLDNGL